jgi:hypothetical protein
MRLIIAALLLVGCLEIRSCCGWMVPMASSFLRRHDSSSIPLFSKSSRSSLNRICIDRPLFSSSSTNPAPSRRHGGGLCLGASEKDEFVEAEDLEALQTLFSKYCDSEGLMTKLSVMQIPAISELMVRVLCAPVPLFICFRLVCDDTKCSRITPRQCRIKLLLRRPLMLNNFDSMAYVSIVEQVTLTELFPPFLSF